MKFKYSVRYALAAIAFALISSCGGGGAKVDPNQGGLLVLLPTGATFYAGVVYTISVQGGKAPYAFTSTEPELLPLPSQTNSNTIQVVGANPSTIDTGLGPNDLPVRTVNITVRDGSGQTANSSVKVARNFLTGSTLAFTNTTCVSATGTAATTLTPCAGGDTTAQLVAEFAGNLIGGATLRLDVVTGTMGFVNPIGSNTVTQSFTATSDHNGVVTAIVRVPGSAPTQIGVIRVTDVASGVSTNYAFTITGQTGGALTAIPSSFSFTGGLVGQCGTGSGDFFVTGGVPPYHASSSDPNVAVVSDDAGAGRFTLTASNPNVCLTTATIVITDSGNTNPANRTTVTVTTTAGSGTPPPSALSVTPTTLGTLTCGTSASVVVVGGAGTYQAASSNPVTVTPVVSGNIVTITSNDNTNNQQVTITDGANSVTVSVPHCT